MDIAILGAKGMLGMDLTNVLDQHNVSVLDVGRGDITKPRELREILTAFAPQVVVNCAAFTQVDDCEEKQSIVNQVNGFAVADVAEICKDVSAAFIHVSTDYVFDGTQKDGYYEDDTPNPINAYGRSKCIAEELLQGKEVDGRKLDTTGLKWYIVRLCWLYGEYGGNFVDTMVEQMNRNKELRIVTDQWGKPTWTRDAAIQLKLIIETLPHPGIYHVSNEGVCNRYEWVEKIKEILGKNDVSLLPAQSSEFKTAAKRPQYSALMNTKLPPMRHWEAALRNYLSPEDPL